MLNYRNSIICFLLGFIFVAMNGSNSLAFAQSGMLKTRKVDLVKFNDIDDFKEFMHEPNTELYSENEDNFICSFSLAKNENDTIVKLRYYGKSDDVLINDSCVRFSWFLLYVKHAQFACNENNELLNFLANNGVTGECQVKAMIQTPGIPTTLWVVSEQKNYFITIDDDENDLHSLNANASHDDGTCVYRIYTYDQYYEKYVKVRKAFLEIEGEDCSEKCNATISNDKWVFFQLRPAMEQLGVRVLWYEPKEVCLLMKGEKFYILDPDNFGELYFVDDDMKLRGTGPLGGGVSKLYYKILDGTTIVNSDMFGYIARQMGFDLSFHYVNDGLKITQSKN